ncbi:MAG: hypothetical protein GY953_05605 [bacterium]|nr:hypothetical protein [bacterium]
MRTPVDSPPAPGYDTGMGIALPPDLERLVEERITSGRYPDAEAVLWAAFDSLTVCEEEDYWEAIGTELDRRHSELSSGKVKAMSPEEARRRLREHKAKFLEEQRT